MKKLFIKKLRPSQRRREGAVRKKQLPKYQSFKLQKKIKIKKYKPLPSAWKLWKISLVFFWKNKKLIGAFLLTYIVLYILFVRGLSGGLNLGELRDILRDEGLTTGIYTGLTLFGVLVENLGETTSESATFFQGILAIIGSLAFIWMLRKLSSDKLEKIRVRDAFYGGMQPLVPFLLVLLVIALEFIPFSIGSFILSAVMSNNLAGGSELLGIYIVCVLLAVLSLYLFSGSIAAPYIVTLPGMEPVKAIRVSHQLMLMHRLSIIRKILFLTMLLLALGMIVFVPLLLVVPSSWSWLNEYIFLAGSAGGFTIFHIYIYNLYKSLL